MSRDTILSNTGFVQLSSHCDLCVVRDVLVLAAKAQQIKVVWKFSQNIYKA